MTKTKMPYAEALASAHRLVQLMQPACQKVLIAGSLRRKKAQVGDIEMVVLPYFDQQVDPMFGEPTGDSISRLDTVLEQAGVAFRLNGQRMKQFDWEGNPVDLFVQLDIATWGVNATLRTGCAEFSRWLVTERRHGGAKQTGLEFKDGRLYWLKALLKTEEEIDVFMALDLTWVAPEARTEAYTERLWRR